MKKLLIFMDDTAEKLADKKVREKSERVCKTISRLFIANSEGKSWFWKFRSILE